MPSKPNILIVGQSGSGKSSSLEQLFKKHGDKVAFVDFERKGLPFLFDTAKLAFFREVPDYNEGLKILTEAKNSQASIFVYDSLTKWCEQIRDSMEARYTGWDRWNGYNSAI